MDTKNKEQEVKKVRKPRAPRKPKTTYDKTPKTLSENLKRKFTDKQVLQRIIRGYDGKDKVIDYVPGNKVIERLNECFDHRWSFSVVNHDIDYKGGYVYVLGRLQVLIEGEFVTKEQFGGSRINLDINRNVICIGDDLKVATTDAMKKCATELGIGLHLYETERGDEIKLISPDVKTDEDKEKIETAREAVKNVPCSKIQAEQLFNIIKENNLDLEKVLESYNVKDISEIQKKDVAVALMKVEEFIGKFKKEIECKE